jgi:hypothetical protein
MRRSPHAPTLRALLLAAALPLGALPACSPSAPTTMDLGGDDSGDGDGGSGGGSGGSDMSGGFNFATGSGAGTGSGGIDACATSSEEATLVPIDMFVTVDKSGSMGDSSKWTNARAAFLAFFADPAAAGLNVALRFWPDDGCDGTTCSTDMCSQPKVDLGPLSDPTHVEALSDAFNAESPNGGTPMSAALAGAAKWATNYAKAKNGTEKVVIVLLTDGEPNGCDENVGNIAAEAEDAYASAGVLTFAVGLAGSNQGTMDAIAKGGHTDQGFFIGNGNAQADLLAALEQIRKTSVACEFLMPQPTTGETVDPKLVNVSYTPGAGGEAQTLGQVPDAASCSGPGGWYYDDPLSPTKITLCPSTCTSVQADQGAKMQIVLGCSTQPA